MCGLPRFQPPSSPCFMFLSLTGVLLGTTKTWAQGRVSAEELRNPKAQQLFCTRSFHLEDKASTLIWFHPYERSQPSLNSPQLRLRSSLASPWLPRGQKGGGLCREAVFMPLGPWLHPLIAEGLREKLPSSPLLM